MNYVSVVDAAALWGISAKMINYFCVDGRVPNAQKIGVTWIIPKDAPKPEDRRKMGNRKTGSAGGCSDAKAKDI